MMQLDTPAHNEDDNDPQALSRRSSTTSKSFGPRVTTRAPSEQPISKDNNQAEPAKTVAAQKENFAGDERLYASIPCSIACRRL